MDAIGGSKQLSYVQPHRPLPTMPKTDKHSEVKGDGFEHRVNDSGKMFDQANALKFMNASGKVDAVEMKPAERVMPELMLNGINSTEFFYMNI